MQGTGASYDDEAGVYVDGKTKGWEPIEQYYSKYDHPYWLRHNEASKPYGHGGGDYFTLQHFYRCIREKTQPGIDVYDAVQWSAHPSICEIYSRKLRDPVDPGFYARQVAQPKTVRLDEGLTRRGRET